MRHGYHILDFSWNESGSLSRLQEPCFVSGRSWCIHRRMVRFIRCFHQARHNNKCAIDPIEDAGCLLSNSARFLKCSSGPSPHTWHRATSCCFSCAPSKWVVFWSLVSHLRNVLGFRLVPSWFLRAQPLCSGSRTFETSSNQFLYPKGRYTINLNPNNITWKTLCEEMGGNLSHTGPQLCWLKNSKAGGNKSGTAQVGASLKARKLNRGHGFWGQKYFSEKLLRTPKN